MHFLIILNFYNNNFQGPEIYITLLNEQPRCNNLNKSRNIYRGYSNKNNLKFVSLYKNILNKSANKYIMIGWFVSLSVYLHFTFQGQYSVSLSIFM